MPNTTAKRGSSAANLYAGLKRSGGDNGVSFGQVDGSVLRDCVERVTANGDAILFGRTTDGGALSIQILSSGETSKFYVTDVSELFELLEGLINVLKAHSI